MSSILKRRLPFVLIYVAIVAGMGFLFTRIPTSFLPDEDQGVLYAQVQTPAGATAERTQKVLVQMREYLLKEEGGVVDSLFTVNGFNFAGRGQNSGLAFILLKPWEERSGDNTSVFDLAARAQRKFASFRDSMSFAFAPPAVQELGNATGFDLYLQDQAGLGHQALINARDKFLALASKDPMLQRVRPNGLNDQPQYQLVIDDEKARALGIPLADINSTVTIAWGSSYVNDFIDRGRVKRVYVQGRPDSRMNPDDVDKWFVRNDKGAWCRSPRLPRASGAMGRQSCSATTACQPSKCWASGRRPQFGRGHEGDRGDHEADAAGRGLRLDRPVL